MVILYLKPLKSDTYLKGGTSFRICSLVCNMDYTSSTAFGAQGLRLFVIGKSAQIYELVFSLKCSVMRKFEDACGARIMKI